MRLLIHDYPGHAFPVQLARALAARGHEVLHVWSASFQSPKGALAPRDGDPPGLRLLPFAEGRAIAKYDFARRVLGERAYGRALAGLIQAEKPDAVLANGPLDVLAPAQRAARAAGAAFVHWLQDFYGIAIDQVVRRRIPVAGALIGAWYRRLERAILLRADAVVTISEDFRPLLESLGVRRGRTHVIENWAVREEIGARARDNDWARAHGLAGRIVFLYAGTLGLKHNPALLLALARHLQGSGACLAVVSEGIGAEWLRTHGADCPALVLLGFEPHERFPDVLGAADVLVAILESDAGVFSVPSKVLAYLCAGRPILAALPADNLAARTLARSGAGVVVPAGDAPALCAAADGLAGDAAWRAQLGRKALDYAATAFDSAAIAARFETVLTAARAA